jgi:hypothetical protein
MHDLTDVFLIPLVLAIVGAGYYWQSSRSRSLLEGWATRNGYQIMQLERRYLCSGPFFWTTSKGQTVYYVTVRDDQGQVRSGFVRCGGWWLGLWSAKTDVRWDDRRD